MVLCCNNNCKVDKSLTSIRCYRQEHDAPPRWIRTQTQFIAQRSEWKWCLAAAAINHKLKKSCWSCLVYLTVISHLENVSWSCLVRPLEKNFHLAASRNFAAWSKNLVMNKKSYAARIVTALQTHFFHARPDPPWSSNNI